MPNDLTTLPFGELKEIRDGWEYQHSNPFNLDLFTQRAVFERVPVVAEPSIDDIVYPERMTGFDAIFNRASGEVVQMRPVPKSYQLVPHETMLQKQAEQIQDSELRNQSVKVVDRLFEQGKKAHRTIYFTDLTSEVKSRAGNDSVVPRLDVFNSIDMSWAFQVFSGAYRDLCRNTLVFGGEKAYHQKRKHTRNLDTTAMTGKAMLSLDMFTSQREVMDNWARRPLSSRQFAEILEGSICARPARPSDKEGDRLVNKSLFNYMMDLFTEETDELGETMWAGYNALTHWSTHTMEKGISTQKQHDTQRVRSGHVRDILTGDAWQSLELAAA